MRFINFHNNDAFELNCRLLNKLNLYFDECDQMNEMKMATLICIRLQMPTAEKKKNKLSVSYVLKKLQESISFNNDIDRKKFD